MGSRSQMEMMEVLPAIDKDSLKIIEFLCPYDQKNREYLEIKELTFEVNQLSQTDQWKNAQQLISKYATITTPIQDMNILHFANLEILLNTLSSQNVDYLRINLLKSTTLQKFKIFFWRSEIDESLHTLIGEPFRNFSNLKKVWYFRIENTNDYIHIVLDTSNIEDTYGNLKPKLIIFTRVAKEDTPFFELPMNQLMIS
ncbi:hypothetical protein B9Z55_021261 [Caenorhabditis nigoni]|nr:hypothetical protein B9Z55_021261 [Caenorhabditis nigoni]